MWIVKEAAKKRSQMTQKIISDAWTTTQQEKSPIWVDSPIWYKSLRNDIASIDTIQEANASKWVSDLIRHRIDLRKWISNWTVSSWNEAQDYLTMRKSWLVDIFADYMMQDKTIIRNDADAKALEKAIKTDPDAVIWYFKDKIIWERDAENAEAKNKAIDDYVLKWWKLNDVLDYVAWGATTPYGTKDEAKYNEKAATALNLAMSPWYAVPYFAERLWEMWGKLLKWEEVSSDDLLKWNTFLNFLWSARATPIKELPWIAEAIDKKLWWSDEAARKTATVQWASTKWYEQYKAAWKLPEKFSEDFESLYKWYDDAVKNWFVGSVEEYNNYLWDVAVATDKTLKKLTDDFTESYMYDPEWAWADAWQVFWDIMTMVMEEIATAWEATPELAATKIPKMTKTAKTLWKNLKDIRSLKNVKKWAKIWAEMQALEDAYEWELSDVPEYVQTMLTNILLDRWLSTLWTMIKKTSWWVVDKFWWITERGKAWLEWETPASSKEKIAIIKESQWTNPQRTPQKEIWKLFQNAYKTVKEDTDKLYEKKRNYEKNFKWEWDWTMIVDELNTQMEKYLNPEEMWEQTAKVTPRFRLWENRKEELLRKKAEKEAAKTATADAEAEAKRLESLSPEERAEELELKWLQEEEAAKKAAEQERARKYELKVDDKELLESWYSKDKVSLINVLVDEWNKMFVKAWRELNDSNIWELSKLVESKSAWTEWTRDIVEALKSVMKSLQKSMWPQYEELSWEYWAKKDLLWWLEDVLWNLTKRTSKVWTEVWLSEAWEKTLKWISREQLTQLNKYFPNIDLNKAVDSWLIHLAIYDPQAAKEIAKNIYPSLPWVLELLIQWAKLWLTKRAARNIVQENAPKTEKSVVWDTISDALKWKTSEWMVDIAREWFRF